MWVYPLAPIGVASVRAKILSLWLKNPVVLEKTGDTAKVIPLSICHSEIQYTSEARNLLAALRFLAAKDAARNDKRGVSRYCGDADSGCGEMSINIIV
jgi:hypothetical protein